MELLKYIESAVRVESDIVLMETTDERFAGGPSIPPYGREFQGREPSPNLNWLVSVSIPISPAASVGFAVDHCKAVPLRN
jgi:hypothetical protein